MIKKRLIIAVILTIGAFVATYDFWMFSPPLEFDIRVFLIIGICSFLLFYKLTNYLAEFKINKNASRLDIIFLTICAILMFIPMSHINNDEISEKENRKLAVLKPLFNKDNSINLEYGKIYESWIADRFAGRDFAINLFNRFKMLTNSYYQTDRFIQGQAGWLFYMGADSLNNYLRVSRLSEKKLLDLKNYLTEINEYCKANNKQFIFFIAPDKNAVYGEYFDRRFKPLDFAYNKRIGQQLADYLRENTDIQVIYPLDEILKYKAEHPQQYLYYKQDTHWTSIGARIGYEQIIKALIKNGLPLKEVSDFEYEKASAQTDLYRMYPIKDDKKLDKEMYENLIEKKVSSCEMPDFQSDMPEDHQHMICKNNAPNKFKYVTYRDSFTIKLLPYLNRTFSETEYFRELNFKRSTLQDADIVVLESVERFLPTLSTAKFIKD